MNNREYSEDRKLDNRRIACSRQLVELKYRMGDKEITRTVLQAKTRSGYCIDFKSGSSISFNEIGKLSYSNVETHRYRGIRGTITPTWEITAYKHKEAEAMEKLRVALQAEKEALIKKANLIPV